MHLDEGSNTINLLNGRQKYTYIYTYKQGKCMHMLAVHWHASSYVVNPRARVGVYVEARARS